MSFILRNKTIGINQTFLFLNKTGERNFAFYPQEGNHREESGFFVQNKTSERNNAIYLKE